MGQGCFNKLQTGRLFIGVGLESKRWARNNTGTSEARSETPLHPHGSSFSAGVLPRVQEEWYSPCCLGELTLLSGIGRISRAHCFQGLWLLRQSGRSSLCTFPLSGHVWLLEDKEKISTPRYFLFSSCSFFIILVSSQVGFNEEAVNKFEITAAFLCLGGI